MKVLIYGAGVLGSYLAHALIRGGNEVTMLARGERAEELERHGLVIRHYFQLKTSVDPVRVIRRLEPEDIYDLIFVVMKFTDFPSVLPILAENRSSNIVIVGNNTDARDMQAYLQENVSTRKNIAFGFQLSAGRRQPGGRIVSVRAGVGMVIGGLDGPIPFHALLDQAFARTKYKLIYHDNIDAWLKNHIVPILAINYGTFIYNGQMKKIAGDSGLLRQMVAAMDEGFRVLEALGIPLVPAKQAKLIRNHPALLRFFLKIYHLLPVSRMVDGSPHELAALGRVFREWSHRAGIPTPAWDLLEERFSVTYGDRLTIQN
ncbi:ketopantoate reductase family protein [Paenibacillus sp. alder61]|uniref:Ketopantoate reductase family protein n=1 Tax=Paenibacillus faecis TaxID=862114 RepID=A0A5D0CU25_9BACL|nr:MULTISPECIES: 2-dehydropantoate 2-reductase N-terminal domain-containing protein [Paenibacillus]MCA1291882.1 ketopantoate reductase family protein [Paenibacillus sp. alder61]TYA13476.1 ketopantoate reductase family protein [Paenibacillus faecis]